MCINHTPVVSLYSDGVGRTGTYCLMDMVLTRMTKGAKEIDIAATLEHIRDQRPRTVKNKVSCSIRQLVGPVEYVFKFYLGIYLSERAPSMKAPNPRVCYSGPHELQLDTAELLS